MGKFLAYLKKYTLSMLAIIVLLFIQAALTLALPDYMSRIVNVGIQQSGIDSPLPEILPEAEYQDLRLLLLTEEAALLDAHYTAVPALEEAGLLQHFPLAQGQPVRILSTVPETEEVLAFLPGRIALYASFQQAPSPEGAPLPLPRIPGVEDPLSHLRSLDGPGRQQVLEDLVMGLSVIPDSTLAQAAVLYTSVTYAALGRDLEALQSAYILRTGAQMTGIALLTMFTIILVALFSSRVASGLGRDLRRDVFRKVTSFSSQELSSFSTASLITRSTNDIQQVQNLLVFLLRMVFYAPLLGIGGIFKAWETNRSMAWVIGVAVLAILLVVIVLFTLAMPRFKLVQRLVDKVNLVTRESLVGMMVIRAFNTEAYEEEKFETANTDLTRVNLFVSRLMASMNPLMMLIMNGIIILIVWVGAAQIDLGIMQVGDMMAYIQYSTQIIMSFLMLSMTSIIIPRASVSFNRVMEVIGKEPSILDPAVPEALDPALKGRVEFRDVSFHYPGSEVPVLKDISFVAEAGKTVAFIGSTGSGKSTLVNLIPRFYDVTKGQILLQGTDIRALPQKELRRHIAYVPQQGVLFTGTIASNIKYGGDAIDDATMEKAAAIAQSTDFILEKEEGFDAPIAQGGANVSGGQRQRLSIARALATPAEVVIFDDSFSALDYKTDSALRTALNAELDRTILIVAQRISTIKNADLILVLNEGRIVGRGTHRALLEECTIYQEIAASQLSKEEMAS